MTMRMSSDGLNMIQSKDRMLNEASMILANEASQLSSSERIEAILPPKGRDYRLDLLRGFANWAIFLDHIPNNAVNWITQRNYGFSDAADLFVFISGYTASMHVSCSSVGSWSVAPASGHEPSILRPKLALSPSGVPT
jgi:hypothetical protein